SWTRRSFDAQNTGNAGADDGLTPESVKDLTVTKLLQLQNYINATPIVVDGLLVTGDWAGFLYVIDPVTTKRLVKLATGGLTAPPPTGLRSELGTYRGVQSTPLIASVSVPDGGGGFVDQKRIYVGVNSADKTLYCLDLDAIARDHALDLLNNTDGAPYVCDDPPGVWPRSLAADGPTGNGTFNGSMIFAKGHLVKDTSGSTKIRDVLYTPTTGLDCANGQFWALDAYSGELLWSFDPVVNGNGKGGTIWTTPAMSRDGSLVYISTGDCVGQPQIGEKAESLVALDAVTGDVVWFHQRRLIDTADLDIGTGPVVADVDGQDGESGCHVVVSSDKDGCFYAYPQERDVPLIEDVGFDPLKLGQQRLLWRQCFVPGTLNGGFNSSNPALHGRTVVQQFSGYPGGHVGADDANASALDVCDGRVAWTSAAERASGLRSGRTRCLATTNPASCYPLGMDRRAEAIRLARTYVWWQGPSMTLADPRRLLCQILRLGRPEDYVTAEILWGENALRQALVEARRGEIDAKSEHFWRLRFGLADGGRRDGR
ncbi:MAG: PQQ-binding-like beta-propeller repeat protein, partial [Candidatus Binatia bacterium]